MRYRLPIQFFGDSPVYDDRSDFTRKGVPDQSDSARPECLETKSCTTGVTLHEKLYAKRRPRNESRDAFLVLDVLGPPSDLRFGFWVSGFGFRGQGLGV